MLKLLVLQENEKYQVHDISSPETSIGRDLGSKVVLTSKRVSRRHARILNTNEGYILEDLQSTQGTYINGSKITRELLKKDDKISFADVKAIIGDPEEPFLQLKTDDSMITLQKVAEKDYLSSDFEKLRIYIGNLLLQYIPKEGCQPINLEIKTYLKEFESGITGRLAELKTLLEINKLVAPNLEIEALLNRSMKLGLEFFNAQRGFVMLWNEKKQQLDLKACKNLENDLSMLKGTFSDKVSSTCINKNEVIIVDDALIDGGYNQIQSVVEMAIRSILCIPLMYNGKKLGVFYLDHLTKANVFNKSNTFIYRSFGEILSVAMRNTLKYEKVLSRVLI